MKNSQKGFATIPLIIVIIAVLTIGGGVYYKVQKDKVPQESEYKSPATSVKTLTYDSSNLPNQFNFFTFQYPENWIIYEPRGGDVFLLKKEDGVTKNLSELSNDSRQVFIHISMQSKLINADVIKAVYKPIEVGTKKIGNQDIVWATLKNTNEESVRSGDLSITYVLNTPYVDKKSVVFSMTPYSADMSLDIKVLENIIASYRVIETQKGKEALSTSAKNNLNTKDTAGVVSEAKDGQIYALVAQTASNIMTYYTANKNSYVGACMDSKITKYISEIEENTNVRCLAKAQSWMLTAKVSSGKYKCLSAQNSVAGGSPIIQNTEVSAETYASLFNKEVLSCN